MKKRAFTMAEMLVTLGIIGVVAALGLPALMNNVNNQALEKQVVKVYSAVRDAAKVYKAENMTDSFTDIKFSIPNFADKLNIKRKCTSLNVCLPSNYEIVDSASTKSKENLFSSGYLYELVDGSIVNIKNYNSSNGTVDIVFDVNGKQGPNIIGRDLWKFVVFNDGSIDDSNLTPETRETKTSEEIKQIVSRNKSDCLSKGNLTCFGYFKRNDFKFDY